MRKILLILGVVLSFNINAQENLLDTSYGTNSGYTNFAFYTNGQTSGGLQVHETIKLPDGKILAVGTNLFARFTANGLLDTTFNGLGYKYIYPTGNYGRIESAKDGNFIVLDFATGGKLEKINADGNLVPGFTTFTNTGSFIDIFVDPDGKIYLLKHDSYNYFIYRILPNGLLDNTFGSNGRIDLGSTYRYGKIKVNSNNEIFVAGKHEIFVNNRKILVTKITAAGSIDTTFGTGGHFMYPGGEYIGDYTQLELLDDGKILGFTSGSMCSGGNCFGLVMYRLLPNGVLDTTFKNSGTHTIPIQSNSDPTKIQRLQDGSYIISGTGIRSMYALKMNADGILDSSFGLNGLIITPKLSGEGYPAYSEGFELYNNSIVLIGIYSFWYGAQLRYAGTARKYFFSTSNLSTQEIHAQKAKLYPNPSMDILHFQSEENVLSYEIYDFTGKKIDSGVQIVNNSINISHLISGTYLLNLKTEKGIITSQFIKK